MPAEDDALEESARVDTEAHDATRSRTSRASARVRVMRIASRDALRGTDDEECGVKVGKM